jgi:hypothetical protein
MRFFAMLAPKCTHVRDKDASSKSVDDCHDARRARAQKNAPQPSRRCGENAEQQQSTRLPMVPAQYCTSLHHISSKSFTIPRDSAQGLRNDIIDEQRDQLGIERRKMLVKASRTTRCQLHFFYTKLQTSNPNPTLRCACARIHL